jgi:hypothetical protein
MATLAQAIAQANADINASHGHLGTGGLLMERIIVANHVNKILELSGGIGGIGGAIRSATTHLWGTYESHIRALSSPVAPSEKTRVTTEIATMEQKILNEPIDVATLTRYQTQLSPGGSFVTRYFAVIGQSKDLILRTGHLIHEMANKFADIPTAPSIHPAVPTPITTLPLNITGNRMGWVPADQKIEIFDASGTNKLAEQAPWAAPFSLSLTTLLNGNLPYILRATNPTTNVYTDTNFNLNVAVPKDPETPDNLSKNITTTPTGRWRITGKLKTNSHTIRIISAGADITATCLPSPMRTNPDGSFFVDLPVAAIWEHKYQLIISNSIATKDHSEEITLNVSEPAAPTIAPISMATSPHMTHTDVPLGEHHAHIEHHNPIPGSTITISGQGLANPVTINVPLTHGHHAALPISLPGFDTHTAGIKNMTIVTTDPHNPNNKRTDNFDITVEEDPHHLVDNRRLSKAYFLRCTRETGYQIQWDERLASAVPPPVPPRPRVPNYNPHLRTYAMGKNIGMAGWWAEVPYLPWEKPLFREQKKLRAATQNGLYDKIQLYLRELNARAAAMNHGDHDDHGEHPAEHPATPATPATHTAPSGNDAHEAAAAGHAEGHWSDAKWGKFAGAVAAVWKTAAWPAGGALAGLGYAAWAGGAVLLGPAVVGGAVAGASIWALRKLWRIKNPKKWGGDSHAHH